MQGIGYAGSRDPTRINFDKLFNSYYRYISTPSIALSISLHFTRAASYHHHFLPLYTTRLEISPAFTATSSIFCSILRGYRLIEAIKLHRQTPLIKRADRDPIALTLKLSSRGTYILTCPSLARRTLRSSTAPGSSKVPRRTCAKAHHAVA